MTCEACDKFVGPMPVNEFLSDFVPEAAEKRPANDVSFSDASISRNEKDFVSHSIPRGVSLLTSIIIDSCNGGIWYLPRTHI